MARLSRMIEHVWTTGGWWAAAGVLLLAVGCGDGSPTAPTSVVDPTPQPQPPTPPTVFTLSGQVTDHKGRRVNGATVRVLDGPHEGASVKTGANGRYALPDLTGNLSVSAMKSGYVDLTATAGPMETMLDFVLIERGVADYIEALFLGLGPLSPTDGNSGCPDGQYGYWIGWENSNLRVTVSDVVDRAAKRLVERAAAQVSEATAGRYSATYFQTGVTNPIPGRAEVTLTEHPDPVGQGCVFPRGCTLFTFAGHQMPSGIGSQFHSSGTSVLEGARAIIQTSYSFPQGHLHDAIGHGALGLCHIDGERNGGTQNSLMSSGPGSYGRDLPDRLTQRDLDAITVVFSSDLTVGARRSDFVREGLVSP